MSITTEEFHTLNWMDQRFYLEHHNYVDCKVIDGKLCVALLPNIRLSWARFMELYNALPLTSYAECPDGEISFYKNSDFTDWNKYSRKYVEYGFEYFLTINVRHGDHTREGQLAEKQLLTDWLLAHGGTEAELAAVQYNWHGYSINFCCRFTECPYDKIPEKMHKWLLKNPQWAHRVYNEEAMKVAADRSNRKKTSAK